MEVEEAERWDSETALDAGAYQAHQPLSAVPGSRPHAHILKQHIIILLITYSHSPVPLVPACSHTYPTPRAKSAALCHHGALRNGGGRSGDREPGQGRAHP